MSAVMKADVFAMEKFKKINCGATITGDQQRCKLPLNIGNGMKHPKLDWNLARLAKGGSA